MSVCTQCFYDVFGTKLSFLTHLHRKIFDANHSLNKAVAEATLVLLGIQPSRIWVKNLLNKY